MSINNDEEVPPKPPIPYPEVSDETVFLLKLMTAGFLPNEEGYKVDFIISCTRCKKGDYIHEKNGARCVSCEQVFCEACCDDGFFDDDDNFDCRDCIINS